MAGCHHDVNVINDVNLVIVDGLFGSSAGTPCIVDGGAAAGRLSEFDGEFLLVRMSIRLVHQMAAALLSSGRRSNHNHTEIIT